VSCPLQRKVAVKGCQVITQTRTVRGGVGRQAPHRQPCTMQPSSLRPTKQQSSNRCRYHSVHFITHQSFAFY